MKLYARTPAGTGLGLNVLLTGQVREEGNTIRRVEVILPIGCDPFVAVLGGYAVEALPKSPMGQQLLWADPGDVCANDGSPVNQDQLRAEVARVHAQARLDMASGPLGENWP